MFETALIRVDVEFASNKILAPLFDSLCNGEEFSDVGGGDLHAWAKALAKEGNGMVIL